MLDHPGDPAPTPHTDDPAAPRPSPPWLVSLAVALIITVGLLQRPSLFGNTAPTKAAVPPTSLVAPPPQSETMNVFGRIAVGIEHLSPGSGSGSMLLASAAEMAETRADSLRANLLTFDVTGAAPALQQLGEIEAQWDKDDAADAAAPEPPDAGEL